MAEENENQAALEELVEEVERHSLRLSGLKSALTLGSPEERAAASAEASLELLETFLPLLRDVGRDVATRLSDLEDEVFPAIKISESDAVELAEMMVEASAHMQHTNPTLAARLDAAADGIASELGEDVEGDDEEDGPEGQN